MRSSITAGPKHLSFRYIVTTGNEACLETFDFVDYMLDEGKTDAFLLLLEEVKNVATFERVAAKALRAGKPLIVGKLGQSEAGSRAVALAYRRAGRLARRLSRPVRALRRDRRTRHHEMVDIAQGFLAFGSRLPAGRRVGICTSSGGGGALAADACVAAGLDVPELDGATRALIDVHLPSYGTSQNPVDVTAQAVHALGYAEFARLVAGSPAVDGVIVVVTGRSPRLLMGDREKLDDARARDREADLHVELHPAGAGVQRAHERGRLSAVHQRAPLRPRHAAAGRLPGGARTRDARVRQQRKESQMGPFKDIGVETSGLVASSRSGGRRNNFFDIALIHEIAGALEALDQDAGCRAVVLASQGKAFCAGANFGDGSALDRAGQRPGEQAQPVGHLYIEAVRLFRIGKPIIGAIHGAAVGGGLGLALVADFRVTCPEARFCANFTRLGFHPGFGLTTTLPEVIGKTNAALMFYTSRRVTGEEAHRMGLADVLVAQEQVRAAALKLAAEIAENAPLAWSQRGRPCAPDLADRVQEATEHELAEQSRLRKTDDFKEGVKAMSERRVPNFAGR